MQYPAVITKEGKYTLAAFPDCPGCQTFAERRADLVAKAADALVGWLASSLAHGDVPRAPSKHPKGKVIWVPVPANLAAKLELRWARRKARLTQGELAKRAGVSQAMVAKVESPGYRPSLDVLEKIARGLGKRVRVGFEAA
jgi:DNA-binding XRE family transcriptional regulator/predicted RNase H-like HicB family nuclease